MAATRILALDPGTKRIGVALSDELGWFAQPLETFERRTLDRDVAHIQRLVDEHDVREVVLGMPFSMDGTEGTQAASVRRFQEHLARCLSVPVIAWDERLTSASAERLLIEADVSRRKRRGAVDRVAAALLLQSYLEHREGADGAGAEGGAAGTEEAGRDGA